MLLQLFSPRLAYDTDELVYESGGPSAEFLSFHDSEIPPKVLKTVCAAEKRGEVR
jgi:hypothetical protein